MRLVTKISAVLAFCMILIPASAGAMEPITETEMDAVTGQGGIAMVIDDVQLYKHRPSGPWFQNGTNGDTAALGLSGIQGMLYINAVLPAVADGGVPIGLGKTGVLGEYASDTYDFSAFTASPMKVNVTTKVPALSAGAANNASFAGDLNLVDTAIIGLTINLPTAEIYFPGLRAELSMTHNPEAGTARSFGRIYTRGTMTMMDGHLEIVPGGRKDIYDMVLETMSLF